MNLYNILYSTASYMFKEYIFSVIKKKKKDIYKELIF